jgi:glutamate-5-semialdehyde dehydrogenase
MTAPLKAIDGTADLPALMNELATHARTAARAGAGADRTEGPRAGGDGRRHPRQRRDDPGRQCRRCY